MTISSTKILFKALITVGVIFIIVVFIKADFLKAKSLLTKNVLWQSLQVEQQKVKNKAMLITINHYRPDLSQWKNFFAQNALPDKSFLNDSVQYYQTIVSYFPQMAQAQHMLGVCYYFLGETQTAIVNQQKAIALEPRFFWAWYDLGLIYYRQGEFAKSAEIFRRALSVSPAETVKIIESSRIFNEILQSVGLADVINAQSLEQGYADAARLLKASISRLQGQPINFDDGRIPFKIY